MHPATVKVVDSGSLGKGASVDGIFVSIWAVPVVVAPPVIIEGASEIRAGNTASVNVVPENLPNDPFNMTPRMRSSTIHELQNLETGVQDDSLALGQS